MRDRLTIIPAAGLASRLGGLPKFLLPSAQPQPPGAPSAELDTLLRSHIETGLQFSDLVIIATRPENAYLVIPYLLPHRVEMMVANTATMTETVMRVANVCRAEQNLVLMPDTVFSDGLRVQDLPLVGEELVSLAVWRITSEQVGAVGQVELVVDTNGDAFVTRHEDKNSDCQFPFVWGAMNMSAAALPLLSASMPHVGYVISEILSSRLSEQGVGARVQSGRYIDCGTPEGYLRHLER